MYIGRSPLDPIPIPFPIGGLATSPEIQPNVAKAIIIFLIFNLLKEQGVEFVIHAILPVQYFLHQVYSTSIHTPIICYYL
jgi:hypothetical protein